MPITRSATIAYYLSTVVVDIPGAYMLANFSQMTDGMQTGSVSVRIEGADMLSIIGVPASVGKSRADDITDAVYAYAVQTGKIVGAIS